MIGEERHRPCQQTCVDQVEAFSFVEPFCFVVLDDEFEVWTKPVWLNRTNVVPNDVGFAEIFYGALAMTLGRSLFHGNEMLNLRHQRPKFPYRYQVLESFVDS